MTAELRRDWDIGTLFKLQLIADMLDRGTQIEGERWARDIREGMDAIAALEAERDAALAYIGKIHLAACVEATA